MNVPIAPARALFVLTILVALPLCTMIGLDPARAAIYELALLILAAASGLDAWLGLRNLECTSASCPNIIRATQNIPAEIPVKVGQGFSQAKGLPIRVSVDLPNGIETESPRVTELTGSGAFTINFTPRERGVHTISRCSLEIQSPAHLWLVRTTLPLETELRVYPDMRGDKTAAALLRRRDPGSHRFRQLGRGREFERLRDYLPGDTFDEVSWKATARRGRPVVRVFQIERTQEVYVALDISRLSGRHAAIEDYVKAALLLGLAAESQGDKFGLVTFSDRVHSFLRAAQAKQQYSACREALYRVRPQPVSPDFAELFTFLQLNLRRRALVIFLTALDDPLLAETFSRDLTLLTRRHLAVVALMNDPEVQPVFEGPVAKETGDVYRRLAGHLVWTQLRETEKKLERHGVIIARVDPDRVGAQLAEVYANIKRRQLL
jgi:uncharacterized protein (DUF58 family)